MGISNRITNNTETERVLPFFSDNNFPVTSESEKTVLGVVLRSGEISQPNIAHKTGLAQQSVSRIVKGLLDRGAFVGGRVSNGRRGQPSMTVRVEPTFAYSFGIVLMTDAFSVALMDFSGAVLDEVHCDTVSMTRSVVIPKIQALFDDFIEKFNIPQQRIFGIGLGISGYCLGGHGRYNSPLALDDWALVDLEDVLSEQFGLPVWVENDANAAAVGESLVGQGRVYNNFVYLYIAAGIGGGVIINGELLRGCHGNGGEVGLILPSNVYLHPTLDLLRRTLIQNGVHVDGLSDMLARFDPTWPGVDEWISRTQDAFSLIISALSAILDTEAIVLGGRIPRSLAEKVIPHIEVYDDARRSAPRPVPRIVISDSSDAGAVGAAALPLKKCFFTGSV
ncbi:ROK family transcriptional regulator [Agarilytica rhodophyticola]|uniref:ROK family transcriptional regulator n=1 Tax=Agarilytica rhodophyticola TaxID=1737490 RepID=UPI000B349EF8|nr:ROK family transcriptional regulator [Agarilytica rhodophyticola]